MSCDIERLIPARKRVSALVLGALLGLLASPALAEKTDVVVMDNGNVIVGEVEKLDRALLYFSVDDVQGDLRIEWEHVVRLTSNQQLDIELASGEYYLGSLVEPSADGELRIQTAAAVFDVKLAEVVIVEPIEETFWKRIDANVSTGLSFTKSTDLMQFNFGGSVRYCRLISLTDVRLNTIITSKSDEANRTNSDFGLTHYRYFKNRWFYRGDVAASRNDELGIDFRGSLGGGLGRRVVQSNRALFLVSGLLSANREFTSDGARTDNFEFVVDTTLMADRYDTPKLEIRSNLAVFVNLTTKGRYRVDFDGRISLELIEDLFWDISQIYYRFDSDPSTTAASKDDYGIITGVRYKF